MEASRKKAHTKATEVAKKDRKSGTGMSGEPKKGGHGGKYTWAGDVRVADEEQGGALDAKDPNYEDAEGEQQSA